MNIIYCGYSHSNRDGMEFLIDKMNIKYLGYFYYEFNDKDEEFGIDSEGFYIYESIEKTLENVNECIPLDGDIVSAMSCYESTAMTLINRWRNTLLKKETYSEAKGLYLNILRYWNDYLTTKKIDLCFFENIPHAIQMYVIYVLCKIKGIKVIMSRDITPAEGIEAKTFFQVDFDNLYDGFQQRYDYFKKLYKDKNMQDIPLPLDFEKYFDIYAEGQSSKKNATVIQHKLNFRFTLNICISRAKLYLNKGEYRKLLRKAKDFFVRKITIKLYLKFIEKNEVLPVEGEKYIFFPLHLQPEATTCPNAGIFDNQMLAIQMISYALPEGTFLYVKEHPAYWMRRSQYDDIRDYRNSNFKKELLKCKNVRIIKHDFDSKELAQRSKGIASINGSIIWESIFKQKPVFMCGNAFYANLEGMNKVNNLEECRIIVNKIFNETIEIPTLKDIAIFLNAFGEITTFGCPVYSDYSALDSAKMDEKDNSMAIAQAIYDFYLKAYNL